jgi:hypothetical protein
MIEQMIDDERPAAKSRRPRMGQEFWQQAIDEQRHSGLTAKAFCQQRDLALPSFYAWRGKLRRMAEGDEHTASGFMELVESGGGGRVSGSGVSVVLSGGETRIELGRDFCVEALRRALSVLREAAR